MGYFGYTQKEGPKRGPKGGPKMDLLGSKRYHKHVKIFRGSKKRVPRSHG